MKDDRNSQRRVAVIASALALFMLAVGFASNKTSKAQSRAYVPATQQDLISAQGAIVKSLEINMHQPRLLKKIDNVSFDEEGAKQAKAFAGLNSTLDSEVLEVPFPLRSVSLSWSGSNGVSQNILGYVRNSESNSTWSEWIPLESAGEEFSSTTVFESLSVFVPANAKYVQFRLQFLNGVNGPTLDRVRLNYTAQEDNGTENLYRGQNQEEQSIGLNKSAITVQAVSAPRIITRTEWGCPDGENSPKAPPEPNTPITNLIVHHTRLGTQPRNPNDYKAWIYNIWYEHTYSKGWGDIGYNLLIDPQGNVYEGRAGGVDAKGFHFSCHNSYTTGIALLGDFSTSLPTKKALAALEQVLAWRSQVWGIDPKINSILYSPDSSVPALDIPSIAGHRDSNPVTWSCTDTDARTCPGDALYGLLPNIRNDVAQMLPPGFALQLQSKPGSLFLTQGAQANIGVNLDSYGGLSGTASISATGLPQGMSVIPTTVFVPANGNVSATLGLKSSLSTPTGQLSVTITASLGGIQKTTKLSVTILAAPGSVTVKALNNGQPWAGQMDYDVVGPQGVIIGLGVPVTTLNLPPGQYTFVYHSGGPGTLKSISPSSIQTLVNGGTLTFTLNFCTTVSPLSVSCAASPSVITTGQSSTFSASVTGGVGPYLITWSGAVSGNTLTVSKVFNTTGTFTATVTASDGSLQSKQGTCSVLVNAALVGSFDVYTFNPSKTIQSGQSTSFDLYFQPQGGFSGQIGVSLSGLPSGASMTSSSQLNLSGTSAIPYSVTIQTGTSTPVGVFPLVFTASGQGITRTVNLTLTTTAPPPQPLSASCSIVPNPITLGTGATAYAQASGGVPPFVYIINNVNMGGVSSLLVMPSAIGTFTVPVTIIDSRNQQASNSCSAQVVAADPYVTGFNYTPNPAKATQRVDLNIYGGNFNTSTQVWFVGPGCAAPGCQTNVVTVSGTAYIAAAAQLNLTGTYTVNIRNGSGTWVKAGTVNVVQ